MSIQKEMTVSLKCDKCNDFYNTRGHDKNARRWIRSDAKEKGWKLGKKRDLCPKCAAEIAEQIKQLQSGE